MWKVVIAILLIPAALRAQSQALNPQVPNPNNLPATTAKIYQRFSDLRRGTTEDVGLMLLVPGFLASPKASSKGIVPVSLEFDPDPELTLSKTTYPTPFGRKLAFHPEPMKVFGGNFPITMRIKAAPSAALGWHILQGKLTYQVITDAGPEAVQVMNVTLPLNIVDHKARITINTDWPFHHTSTAGVVGMIVLCIALLPIILPLAVICLLPGMDGCG